MKNTIVIVDDNEVLLSTCVEILEKQGFEVFGFTDVVDAKKYLATANGSAIHAIVSDLMMGPADGLEFLSFVKSVPTLAQIDFFLMTGAFVPVFEPFYRDFFIKGVIEKPFDAKTLIGALTANESSSNFKQAA